MIGCEKNIESDYMSYDCNEVFPFIESVASDNVCSLHWLSFHLEQVVVWH